LPGTHNINAQYGGDTNYLPGVVEVLASPQVVQCDTNLTGDIPNAITVRGGSTCIVDATVHGGVSSRDGALFIGHSTIIGGVTSSRGTFVGVCNSTIDGAVVVQRASQFVVIGDAGDDGCPGNDIHGAVLLDADHGAVDLVGNTIGGGVTVNAVTGVGPFPIDIGAAIAGNAITGALGCTNNVPAPSNRGQPNTVTGARSGQCTGL
jgi:hypothetical protein